MRKRGEIVIGALKKRSDCGTMKLLRMGWLSERGIS